MLAKPKTRGPAVVVEFKRRKKKRNRRLLEAVPADWERWDAAAKVAGLNWSEFTRRALNTAAGEQVNTGVVRLGNLHPEAMQMRVLGVSEKGAAKTAPRNGRKSGASRGARKG